MAQSKHERGVAMPLTQKNVNTNYGFNFWQNNEEQTEMWFLYFLEKLYSQVVH